MDNLPKGTKLSQDLDPSLSDPKFIYIPLYSGFCVDVPVNSLVTKPLSAYKETGLHFHCLCLPVIRTVSSIRMQELLNFDLERMERKPEPHYMEVNKLPGAWKTDSCPVLNVWHRAWRGKTKLKWEQTGININNQVSKSHYV